MRENVGAVVRRALDQTLGGLEGQLDADVIGAFGPILSGAEHNLRSAMESIDDKWPRVAIVLQTLGGIVEVVERMVDILRHHYTEVHFYVPDVAMSAGTVLAMSGDSIHMNYFSRLGPVDPQIEKDGKLVPALSYLAQYQRFVEQSRTGELSDAEISLLIKLDLAELHQYEQARDLTITLMEKWLATFKFKNWAVTESRKQAVSDTMRKERARDLAAQLSDNERWHSHARGISMATLRDELNLKIDDFDLEQEITAPLRSYCDIFQDYIVRENATHFMVMHTRSFL